MVTRTEPGATPGLPVPPSGPRLTPQDFIRGDGSFFEHLDAKLSADTEIAYLYALDPLVPASRRELVETINLSQAVYDEDGPEKFFVQLSEREQIEAHQGELNDWRPDEAITEHDVASHAKEILDRAREAEANIEALKSLKTQLLEFNITMSDMADMVEDDPMVRNVMMTMQRVDLADLYMMGTGDRSYLDEGYQPDSDMVDRQVAFFIAQGMGNFLARIDYVLEAETARLKFWQQQLTGTYEENAEGKMTRVRRGLINSEYAEVRQVFIQPPSSIGGEE